MSAEPFNRYSLYPDDDRVLALRQDHGVHQAKKQAWRESLTNLLSEMDEEDMTPNEQRLHAVLWGLFESGLL